MRLFFCFIYALVSVVAVAVAVAGTAAIFPNHFLLHRAFPHFPSPQFHSLKARDRLRHSRLLRRLAGGIVNFSVKGSSNPFIGLYFTKVKLGNPEREFNVQIDTGSDILWVTCSPCDGCPETSGLGIELNLFDTTKSSSARVLPCTDPICAAVSTTTDQCLSQIDHCSYTFHYRDRSGTSGFYVTDSMHFDILLGESTIANSSATIVFGCSIYQYGDLTRATKALDGIFGFGQGEFSVISQLSSRGITPKVFSHCLKGGENGGGILVLGEILEPSIVYSPLIPSQPHYTLNLQSIALSGQLFPNPTMFPISNAGETIIDSGTTLAYLVEEVYDWIVSVITSAVSQSATPTISRGSQCFRVSTSVAEIFPVLSFNFKGIASMVVTPEEYLQFDSIEPALWCIGFQKAEDGLNILGDLVLKDKIIVYDLARQRIGWANYDCSSSVNVSVTSGKDVFINEGQLSESSSIHSNANLGVHGQGYLNLTGPGNLIEAQRLILSLFFSIYVGPKSFLRGPLDDSKANKTRPRLYCELSDCPAELLHPSEDCNVNSTLPFTLQICRVEDLTVEGTITGSVIHFHWVRDIFVYLSCAISASGLGCTGGVGRGRIFANGLGAGGGHGGKGGDGYYNGTFINGGVAYGDPNLPCELGSGSGNGSLAGETAGGGIIDN